MDLDKLSAAKLWLISPPPARPGPAAPKDLPYLAHALYALIAVESPQVERMSVDERWRVYVNPTWLAGASVPEVGSELAHVTWHLLSEHAVRARDQGVDASLSRAWGQAADATISHTLAPDALAPPALGSAESLGLPADLSTEEYFALIARLPATSSADGEGEPGAGCGSGADGVARSHELGPDVDVGHVSRSAATEITRKVAIEYAAHLATRGTDPGDALRWVRRVLEPTVDWQPLLGSAVRRAVAWAGGRGEPTYTKISRRASSVPGIVLPGQRRPVPRVAVVVDTSASVDDELLARALGEIDSVLASQGVAGTEVTVYSVDAAIHTVQRVRRALDAALVGAGGTDLRQGLQAAGDERPRPDVIIVMTDGDTPWPSTPPPGCTVVAAILGRHGQTLPPTPAWAARVECRVDPSRRV